MMDASAKTAAAAVQRPGRYASAVAAYLTACVVSTFSLSALNGASLNIKMLGLTAAVASLMGIIPFVVIKTVMDRFAWTGVLPHVLGGALAVPSGFLLLGYGGLMDLKLMFHLLLWGAIAGLVYWGARSIFRKLFMGVPE